MLKIENKLLNLSLISEFFWIVEVLLLLETRLDSLLSLRLGHHHLAELVKVHGSGSVLVQLVDDSIQLLVAQRGEKFSNERPQCFVSDVSQALLVVDSKQKNCHSNLVHRL